MGKGKQRTCTSERLVFTVDTLSVLVIGYDFETILTHKLKFVVVSKRYIRRSLGIVKVGGPTVILSLETVRKMFSTV